MKMQSKQSDNVESGLKRVVEIGSLLKTLGGWVFGATALVVSVVFWIQSQGIDKYYPKISGENLEKQVARMEQRFDSLEDGNNEIIRLLGRLEASIPRRRDER
jgi:hypothetical protein